MAARTLIDIMTRCACVLMCSLVIGIRPTVAAADLGKQVTFDIPAQQLPSALLKFAAQSGVQITSPGQLIEGKSSAGVRGSFDGREALERILKDTELRFDVVDENTVMIVPVATSPTKSGMNVSAAGALEASQARRNGESVQRKRFWDRFRVAQVDSGKSKATEKTSESPPGPEETPSGVSEDMQVVVTGTNIRGIAPTSPVTVLDRRYIESSGRATVADVIRTLPQNFNGGENVGNIGSGVANQDLTGSSSPNLRGLGTGSTLTLVNGHRLAFNGYQGGADISVVPLAAVDRIEVVTDGASAIYGSDAVAGVVNIRLRSDYRGAETRLRYGDSAGGGAALRQFSQVAGTAWSGGNLVGAYEYNETEPLYVSERRFARSLSSRPYTLLPRQDRHSLFAALRQDLTPSLTGMVEALYTYRRNISEQSDPFSYNIDGYHIKQYSASAGLEARFGSGWEGEVHLTQADDLDWGRGVYAPDGGNAFRYEYPYQNRTRLLEGKASGRVADVPAGRVMLAVGAGYRDQLWHSWTLSGGSVSSDTNVNRNSRHAFAELRIPLVAGAGADALLETTLAARYEDYSIFGSNVDPKVGFILRPGPQLTFKASWGTSFRAPELYRQLGGTQVNLQTLAAAPPSGKTTYLLLYGSNPQVGPESSESWNASVQYDPAWQRDLSIKLSGFRIAYKDRIDFPFAPYFVPLGDPETYAQYFQYDPTEQQQIAAIDGKRIVSYDGSVYDPANVAFILDSRYKNIGRVEASGVDLELSYGMDAGGGRLSLVSAASWLREKLQATPTLPVEVRTGTVFNPPRLRGRAGVFWEGSVFTASGTINYTDGFRNNRSALQTSIDPWATLDLQLTYSPRRSWLEGVQLKLDVQNALDEAPPAVLQDSFFFLTGLGFDPTNASAIGRFVSVELVKRW